MAGGSLLTATISQLACCEVPEAGGSKLAAARPPAKPNYLLAGGSRLAAARPPTKPDFLFARGSLLASGALLACGTLLARPPAKPNYGKEGKCSQEYAAAGRSAAFMLTALSQLDSLLARPSPRWGLLPSGTPNFGAAQSQQQEGIGGSESP